MILTGGRFRGRSLKAPRGDKVRPTPSRVKEALFSILAQRLVSSVVLDLYAGTGALGLEALSRGAAHATFVEVDSQIAQNLQALALGFGLELSEAQVLPMRVETCIPRLPRVYDLVFADPPYVYPPPIPVLSALLANHKLQPHVRIMYEHAATAPFFDARPFVVVRRESWGEVAVSFLELG